MRSRLYNSRIVQCIEFEFVEHEPSVVQAIFNYSMNDLHKRLTFDGSFLNRSVINMKTTVRQNVFRTSPPDQVKASKIKYNKKSKPGHLKQSRSFHVSSFDE